MTMPADDLEGRYRRLVGLFPPAYRAARGEEMVSALMDGAVPGQQRPRRGEQWDLRLAAARQWARSALLPPADAMPATVAVLAWLLPSVLLYPAAKAVSLAAAGTAWGGALHGLEIASTSPAWAGWGIGVAALLLGRRRAALILLTASAALLALTIGALLARGATLDVLREAGWLVGQAVALCAVLLSPDRPGRRWRLVGALLALATVLLSLSSAWMPHNQPLVWAVTGALIAATCAALLLTRYRYAVPPLAAAAAALWAGRFGLGAAAPHQIPLEGLTLDPATVAAWLAAPVLTYLACATVLSLADFVHRPQPQV